MQNIDSSAVSVEQMVHVQKEHAEQVLYLIRWECSTVPGGMPFFLIIYDCKKVVRSRK